MSSSARQAAADDIGDDSAAVRGPPTCAAQRLFRLAKSQRRFRDPHDRDARVGNRGRRDSSARRRCGQREVAEAARDFLERPAGMRSQDRKIDLVHDLVRFEAINQRGHKKFFGRDFPATALPLHLDRGSIE